MRLRDICLMRSHPSLTKEGNSLASKRWATVLGQGGAAGRRRRRRGGLFKVAQHPHRFPRSAPNRQGLTTLVNRPDRACGAVAPPQPKAGNVAGVFPACTRRKPMLRPLLLLLIREDVYDFRNCFLEPSN